MPTSCGTVSYTHLDVYKRQAAQCDGKKTELEKAASHAKALQVLMKKIDATYNQNGFQPGVKTGSCHLKPAFDRLYQEVVQRTGK